MPATKKAPPVVDPRKLAVEMVQEWYESLLASGEAHTHGSIYQVTLDNGFIAVQEALEAEHEKEHGKMPPPEDGSVEREIIAQEAGYLIGVQVGLRLRSAGGGR